MNIEKCLLKNFTEEEKEKAIKVLRFCEKQQITRAEICRIFKIINILIPIYFEEYDKETLFKVYEDLEI